MTALVLQWPWVTRTTPTTQRWGTMTNVNPDHLGHYRQRIFKPSAPGCVANPQSAWCMAYPRELGADPDFDVYGASWQTTMFWGPLNLTTAVAAQVSLLAVQPLRPERLGVLGRGQHAQRRGADGDQQHATSARGTRHGRTENWEMQIADLANVRTSTGDSLSMLGLSVRVYFSGGCRPIPDRIRKQP